MNSCYKFGERCVQHHISRTVATSSAKVAFRITLAEQLTQARPTFAFSITLAEQNALETKLLRSLGLETSLGFPNRASAATYEQSI